MKTCYDCFHELQDTDRVCPNCGQATDISNAVLAGKLREEEEPDWWEEDLASSCEVGSTEGSCPAFKSFM